MAPIMASQRMNQQPGKAKSVETDLGGGAAEIGEGKADGMGQAAGSRIYLSTLDRQQARWLNNDASAEA